MIANIVFIVFLLISMVVFAVLVLLVRQIKKQDTLAPEKMSTLTAILFIPALLVFFLVFYGLNDWRKAVKNEQNQQEILQFVARVYQPLADSQLSLLQSIAEMQGLLNGVDSLLENYPNHAELLKKVETEWRARQQVLTELHAEIDKNIRHAWISYKTMNQKDVHDKFYTQAVEQNNRIKKVDKDYQLSIRGVQDELLASLKQAIKFLEGKPTKKTRKNKNNQSEIPEIINFRESTIVSLLAFLERIDAGLGVEVQNMRDDILIARQRYAEVMLYLQDNPDLEQPLNKVLINWKQLEASNQESLNKIVFALEAEYLVLKLGLQENHPAIKQMNKELKLRIPAIVRQARKEKEALERSYTIK